MKFSVSTYSYKRYVDQTKCSYEELCDITKEMGFDGIEFTPIVADDPVARAKEIRQHCDEIGLEISSYTVGANFLKENIDEVMATLRLHVDTAEALGAKVMRHDACGDPKIPGVSYRESIQKIAPYIREITEYAEAKGIKTCTENHGVYMQDPERVEELIRTVNHPNYGWLLDMGNFLCADCDNLLNAYDRAIPYVFHVHAKDFLWKPGTERDPASWGWFKTRGGNHIRGTIVGHGVVPVRQCMAMLKNANYDGYVTVEFEGQEENLRAVEAGLKYLKDCL